MKPPLWPWPQRGFSVAVYGVLVYSTGEKTKNLKIQHMKTRYILAIPLAFVLLFGRLQAQETHQVHKHFSTAFFPGMEWGAEEGSVIGGIEIEQKFLKRRFYAVLEGVFVRSVYHQSHEGESSSAVKKEFIPILSFGIDIFKDRPRFEGSGVGFIAKLDAPAGAFINVQVNSREFAKFPGILFARLRAVSFYKEKPAFPIEGGVRIPLL